MKCVAEVHNSGLLRLVAVCLSRAGHLFANPATARRINGHWAARAGRGTSMLRALFAAIVLAPTGTTAHVRWFTTVSEEQTAPSVPAELLSSMTFLGLFLFAWGVVLVLQSLDNRLTRYLTVRLTLARLDYSAVPRAERILRAGVSLYFATIALYFRGAPILLTPELKTDGWWVPMLQITIAVSVLFRRGTPLACAGIVALYGYSVHLYGLAHLVDYHYFMGMAAFLMLRARSPGNALDGLLILRLSVASSFLWVAAEKWIFPEWTQDILVHQLPELVFISDAYFVCIAAGFVELSLAYFLLVGAVASQVAAATLCIVLVAAIPAVGAVDGIGHLPLIFCLTVLATTKSRVKLGWLLKQPTGFYLLFPICTLGFASAYCMSHELAAERILSSWQAVMASLLGAGALAAHAWYSHRRRYFAPAQASRTISDRSRIASVGQARVKETARKVTGSRFSKGVSPHPDSSPPSLVHPDHAPPSLRRRTPDHRAALGCNLKTQPEIPASKEPGQRRGEGAGSIPVYAQRQTSTADQSA